MLFGGALHLAPMDLVGALAVQQPPLLSDPPMARPSWVGVWATLFSLVLAVRSKMVPKVGVVSWAHSATQVVLRQPSQLRCFVQPLGLPAMVPAAEAVGPIHVVAALLECHEAVALVRFPGPNKDPAAEAVGPIHVVGVLLECH